MASPGRRPGSPGAARLRRAARRRAGGAGVPNYLGWAVLCSVVFFFPAGIVGIVASVVGNRRAAAGDLEGGARASRTARLSCWASFLLGMVGYALLATHVVTFPS